MKTVLMIVIASMVIVATDQEFNNGLYTRAVSAMVAQVRHSFGV